MRVYRDASTLITYVEDTVTEVLGWLPEDLVGRPAIEFVHPEDQPSGIAAWFAVREAPGATSTWTGRYRAADGGWKWIQSVNVNHLDDPDNPIVFSTITLVSEEKASFEEELQARKQLLNRLSDALPVGVIQIDARRAVTFTNDRLHAILGCGPAATTEAQFATVMPEDRPLVEAAFSSALDDDAVADIEIRLVAPSVGPDGAPGEGQVCVLSLRTLSDSSGQVNGAIGCLTDVTESVRLRHQLETRASVDDLTQCLNRGSTLEALSATLKRGRTSQRGTAVVFIDLDRFKPVNDCFGHLAGDRMLVAAAERLRLAIRDCDQVGRVGGDEFLVICPGVDNPAQAYEIGARLSRALTATIDLGVGIVDMRASLGVAWADDLLDADCLVGRADMAMYEAKRDGHSTVAMFDLTRSDPRMCGAG